METDKEKPNIYFLCDRRVCKKCSPECSHTSNALHAKNFELFRGDLIEKGVDDNVQE
ncbi:MAG: hypothetical protein ABF449_09390 [Ethanoligenens sp.]